MYHVHLALQCICGRIDEEGGNGNGEGGSKVSGGGKTVEIGCLLFADDLVLYGESEEDLRAVVGCFIEMYRRRGLKVIAVKSRVMALGWEEGLECEVCVDGIRLEHVSELKNLGYMIGMHGGGL